MHRWSSTPCLHQHLDHTAMGKRHAPWVTTITLLTTASPYRSVRDPEGTKKLVTLGRQSVVSQKTVSLTDHWSERPEYFASLRHAPLNSPAMVLNSKSSNSISRTPTLWHSRLSKRSQNSLSTLPFSLTSTRNAYSTSLSWRGKSSQRYPTRNSDRGF